MSRDTPVRIVLFGQRRNGTTVTFKLFRQIEGLTCYLEPFHPKLIRHPHWQGVPKVGSRPDHDDYLAIQPDLEAVYCPLGGPVYPIEQELSEASWTPRHSAYTRFLLESAPRTLIQPVRTIYHLDHLAEVDGSIRFIWIYRSAEGVISSALFRRPDLFDYPDLPVPAPGQADPDRVDEMPEDERVDLTRRMRRRSARMAGPAVDLWQLGALADRIVRCRPHYQRLQKAAGHVRLMAAWQDQIDAVTRFRARVGAGMCSILRYEDLCADPDFLVRAVCDWSGLPHPTGSLRDLITPDPSPPAFGESPRWKEAHEIVAHEREAYGLTSVAPPTQVGAIVAGGIP